MSLRDELTAGQYVDVGYGCPIELSSVSGRLPQPPFLVPARIPGGTSFQTGLDDAPFLIVDLKTNRQIKRIRIFNEHGIPHRACPLSVQVSVDKLDWHEINFTNYIFGGRVTGEPLQLNFLEPITCRYVKIQVRRQSFLHLDYVEISSRAPTLHAGRLQNIQVIPDSILADYVHHDSHGFSWTFTCTLGAIIAARCVGIAIRNISYRESMIQFKDEPTDDPYGSLFAISELADRSLPDKIPAFERHGVYASFPLGVLRRYVDAYFKPSAKVLAFEAYLVRKYDLDTEQAIVLVYRGTDKGIEVRETPIDQYISVAAQLKLMNPNMKVIIQTDQSQAVEAVISKFPDAIHFEELPTTSGKAVIHNLDIGNEFEITKSELAIRLLAMIHLLSRAKYVVTHTGNIGAWIALYRGSSSGLFQFDTNCTLRDPTGAAIETADLKLTETS
jgi:hypothetical protein